MNKTGIQRYVFYLFAIFPLKIHISAFTYIQIYNMCVIEFQFCKILLGHFVVFWLRINRTIIFHLHCNSFVFHKRICRKMHCYMECIRCIDIFKRKYVCICVSYFIVKMDFTTGRPCTCISSPNNKVQGKMIKSNSYLCLRDVCQDPYWLLY